MKTKRKKGKKRPPLPIVRHGKSQMVMGALMRSLFVDSSNKKEK